MNKKKGSSKNLIKETANAYSLSLTSIKAIYNPKIQDFLVRYEKSNVFRRHKFGVLLVRKGQTNDDQFFSNRSLSSFLFFLYFLFVLILLFIIIIIIIIISDFIIIVIIIIVIIIIYYYYLNLISYYDLNDYYLIIFKK